MISWIKLICILITQYIHAILTWLWGHHKWCFIFEDQRWKMKKQLVRFILFCCSAVLQPLQSLYYINRGSSPVLSIAPHNCFPSWSHQAPQSWLIHLSTILQLPRAVDWDDANREGGMENGLPYYIVTEGQVFISPTLLSNTVLSNR